MFILTLAIQSQILTRHYKNIQLTLGPLQLRPTLTGAYISQPHFIFIIINTKCDHRYLTFPHWSGVTPYTSSYEFAWSCVFDKQLAGTLSLRPLLLKGGLIANLRPLFCLVPWGEITRSPQSARLDYLCRFAVRFNKNLKHNY